jgi:Fe-S cluster assembly iron-binding protein IscA
MITVTSRAAQELGTILEANSTDPKQCLRLNPGMGGVVIGIDFKKEDDEVIDCEGKVTLLIAPEMSDAIDGAVIDYVPTPDGPSLAISMEEAPPKEETEG